MPVPSRSLPADTAGTTDAMLVARRALAELLGTALLVAAAVGSGIAAARLSPGDEGLQLLANAIVTGATLAVIIVVFGPSRAGTSTRSSPSPPASRARWPRGTWACTSSPRWRGA
jgi:hypothetical protein